MESSNDALDLREIGAALRRGWLWIAAGALFGIAVGAGTLALLRPEYKATSTALLRSQVDGSQSVLSRLGGLTGMLPGGLGGGSEVETEVKILTSRAVVGEVVDSLGLQAEVVEPEGASPTALFAEVRATGDAAGAVYRFERASGGYAVEGPGAAGVAVPGVPYRVAGGVLTLRRGELPRAFTVSLLDREDALGRVQENLVTKITGEYVEIDFRAGDPATAAAVPNAVLAEYLRRRRTTDRGVNQHRYEFLTEHTDSIARQLARAEAELRGYQERSGVLDPELTGQVELERAMAVKGEMETVATEARALRGILEKAGSGRLSARELAAYPTFLRNPAVNDVLGRLFELETERTKLLETRTERDTEVVALSEGIRHLEGRLVELGRDYLSGLSRQEVELRRDLGGYEAALGTLPRHAEESLRRIREVKRLSETLIALQSQLVQARLGAISEGGEVRQVDLAVPPRRPVFPNPVLNLLGGLFGGLFFGMVAAVVRARVRPRVHEPWEAELATGVPAVRFDPRAPLSFHGLAAARTVLVSPVGASAVPLPVGERLATTAALQGNAAVLADLTQGAPPRPVRLARTEAAVPAGHADAGSSSFPEPASGAEEYAVYRPHENGGAVPGFRTALDALESRFTRIVAVVPDVAGPAMASSAAADRPVVLVARAGRVSRGELVDAVGACGRLGARVVGVVLQGRGGDGRVE